MFQECFSGPHASGLALSLVPQSSLALGNQPPHRAAPECFVAQDCPLLWEPG